MTEEERKIRNKLIHTLQIYPVVSPSMLQTALGPHIPANRWRPVMEELVAEGTIVRDEISGRDPANRHFTRRRIYLLENEEIVQDYLSNVSWTDSEEEVE